MESGRNEMLRKAVLLFALGAVAASALAGYTTVNQKGENDSEYNHRKIFEESLALPLNSVTANGINFQGADYTFERVQDTSDSDLSAWERAINIGDFNLDGVDQFWHDGTTRFQARARYAGYNQFFGWHLGQTVTSAGVTKLANVTENNKVNPNTTWYKNNVVTLDPTYLLGSAKWQWVRANNAGFTDNLQSSSTPNDDQMVTYLVTNQVTGKKSWWVFWEDITNGGTDNDYNDAVYEFTVIPAPAALALVALGSGLLGWAKRKLS